MESAGKGVRQGTFRGRLWGTLMQHRWLRWFAVALRRLWLCCGSSAARCTRIATCDGGSRSVSPARHDCCGMVVCVTRRDQILGFVPGLDSCGIFLVHTVFCERPRGTFTPASLGDFSLAACSGASTSRCMTACQYLCARPRAYGEPLRCRLLTPYSWSLAPCYIRMVGTCLLVGNTLIVALNAATSVRHLVRCTLACANTAWLVGFLAAMSTLLHDSIHSLLGNTVDPRAV